MRSSGCLFLRKMRGRIDVYLLYVDESGEARGSQFDYFVLSGVALHDEDCYPFARSIEGVVATCLPPHQRGLELHASQIMSGRGPWAAVPWPTRRELLQAVTDHIATWRSPNGRPANLFAVAVHRPSFKGKDVVRIAHEQLFLHFNSFLTRLHVSGESHRALVIADDSTYEPLVQRLTQQWKKSGTTYGKLTSFIEVPLYVDSNASRVVQAADFVAWAVFNYYERTHVDFMQRLHLRFDAHNGVQHGVTHMVTGYWHCKCVPCTSRRIGAVNEFVTPHPL